jgi:hypothetical protein
MKSSFSWVHPTFVFQKSGLPGDAKGSPFREFSRSHWVGWSGQITNPLTVILFRQKGDR